jgi:hypothetical protein
VWYDDRATPTEYLRETMAARRIMLSQYGPDVLQPGEPIGALRDLRLWMTYLHHRWAIESGARLRRRHVPQHRGQGRGAAADRDRAGGAAARSARAADGGDRAGEPRDAGALLEQLTPHPGNEPRGPRDDYAFDHLRAARILSAMVLEPLFAPARAARLVAFATATWGALSLPEVVDAVIARTWGAGADKDRRAAALRRVTQRVALDSLMMLGANANATPDVRSYVLDTPATAASTGATATAAPAGGCR